MRLIQAQPLLIVIISTVSAIFFDGCAILASLNIFGHFTQNNTTLNVPIWKMMSNLYISHVVSRVIEIPIFLNYIQQMKLGPKSDSNKVLKLLRSAKKNLL